MTIQHKTFGYIAISLIVLGLCLRFEGENFLTDLYLKKYNDMPSKTVYNLVKYTGVTLYIGGWLLTSICLSIKHKGNKFLKNSIFSAIIISIVWSVFEYKEKTFVIQPKLPLISCSVLLSSLIALISLKYKLKDVFLIIVASILIVFAEYFVLPFQRCNNIRDGIGLPLLILGWFIIFYVFNEEDSSSKVNFTDSFIPLINIQK